MPPIDRCRGRPPPSHHGPYAASWECSGRRVSGATWFEEFLHDGHFWPQRVWNDDRHRWHSLIFAATISCHTHIYTCPRPHASRRSHLIRWLHYWPSVCASSRWHLDDGNRLPAHYRLNNEAGPKATLSGLKDFLRIIYFLLPQSFIS